MKFKLSVSDFQYAMRLIRGVSPATGPMAESVGVLISAKDDRATFTTYSPEMMAKAIVKIEPEKDGVVVVDTASLYGAISHFQPCNDAGVGTSDITVASTPRSKKLNVSATTRYMSGTEVPHKRVFALRNQEFFPEIPSPDSVDKNLEIPADVLMDALDSVAYAVSSDKSRLIFTGVLMQLADNKMTLFATDGICLAEYATEINYSGDPMRIILPGSFAVKLSKSFFDSDMLMLSFTKRMMFASTPNLVLGGRLIGEEYPDYTAVLPEPEIFVTLNKDILLDNLVNLSYEASSIEASRVSMRFENGEASLVCGSYVNDGLQTDYKGELRFDCNLKLFTNSIRNIVGNSITIGYTDSGKPLKFFSGNPDYSNLTSVLVPLSEQ